MNELVKVKKTKYGVCSETGRAIGKYGRCKKNVAAYKLGPCPAIPQSKIDAESSQR